MISDQHMKKKLMSLREGPHVMMQCYMLQHFADRFWLHEHPGGHASWREPSMRKFTKESTTYFVKGPVCRLNVQKMPSESSEKVRKTTNFFTNSWRIKITLESYFEEHAQEVWEKNWMNPEMQTTLLNTYPPTLFATILKALREQLKENDQLNAVEEIAGPVPEIPLGYGQILKEGWELWDDVNVGYLPEDLVLAARREEEIDWVRSNARVQRRGHETVGPNLGGHGQVCGSHTSENLIEVVCKIVQDEEARQYSMSSTSFSYEAVKVLVSIMMSVSWSNKGTPSKLRHYDISRAHFQGTAQRLIYIELLAEDRQKYGEDKVGR